MFAHGHSRTTLDVDLIVPDISLPSWKVWAKENHYVQAHETDAFLQFKISPNLGGCPLDLMKTDPATFAKLKLGAKDFSFSGVTLPVVGLIHLLALKLHALKTPTRQPFHAQDWADLLALVRKNRLDPLSTDFQDLLQAHATPELRRSIQQEFSRSPATS